MGYLCDVIVINVVFYFRFVIVNWPAIVGSSIVNWSVVVVLRPVVDRLVMVICSVVGVVVVWHVVVVVKPVSRR